MKSENNYKIYYLSSSEEPTNFRYAGYTRKTVEKRLEGHLYSSKELKTHKDKWIQQQLNLGNTIMSFLIEDGITKDDVDEREVYHIKILKEWGFKLTNGTIGGKGNKEMTEETRKKISMANKGKTPRKGAVLTKKTKNKIRDAHIGKKLSEEHKQKIALGGTGRKHDESSKIKISRNNPRNNLGKKMSQETIVKMSDKAKKKPVMQYTKANEFIAEFSSIKEASLITGINKNTISARCNDKRKYASGFIFKFKNEEDKKPNIKVNTQKPVSQYSFDGELIMEYKSISDAVRATNGHRSHIAECCKGKMRSSGGFIWKFTELS